MIKRITIRKKNYLLFYALLDLTNYKYIKQYQ